MRRLYYGIFWLIVGSLILLKSFSFQFDVCSRLFFIVVFVICYVLSGLLLFQYLQKGDK